MSLYPQIASTSRSARNVALSSSPAYGAEAPSKHRQQQLDPRTCPISVPSRSHTSLRRLNVRRPSSLEHLDLETPSLSYNTLSTSSFDFTENDDMYFKSSSSPALTPLGVRLMAVSRNKLASLESPLGGRESGTALWRGVLVREAIRSAWSSLEEGSSELTDWRAPSALGLSTLSEEDESEDYDQDAAEAAWLDDVLSTFGDDANDDDDPAWAETTVSMPEADDFDYADDAFEAFTLPSMSHMDVEEADALVANSLAVDTTVEVSAVDLDDLDDLEDEHSSWMSLDSDPSDPASEVSTPERFAEQSIYRDDMEPSMDGAYFAVDVPLPQVSHSTPKSPIIMGIPLPQSVQSTADSRITPLRSNACDLFSSFRSLPDDDAFSEGDMLFDEECPDLLDCWHPGFHQEDDDDDEDCPCRTPPLMSCEDLEEVAEGKQLGKQFTFSHKLDWANLTKVKIEDEDRSCRTPVSCTSCEDLEQTSTCKSYTFSTLDWDNLAELEI